MGYRSDVRSVIYGPTEVMLPFIAEAGLKRRKVWKQFPGSVRNMKRNGKTTWILPARLSSCLIYRRKM